MLAAESGKATTTTSQKCELRMPGQGKIHIECAWFGHGYGLSWRIGWCLHIVMCAASRHVACLPFAREAVEAALEEWSLLTFLPIWACKLLETSWSRSPDRPVVCPSCHCESLSSRMACCSCPVRRWSWLKHEGLLAVSVLGMSVTH